MTREEYVTGIREVFAELDALKERNDNQRSAINNYRIQNDKFVAENTMLQKQITELQSKLSIAIAAESAMEKKLFNATMELEELRRLNLELQKQLNPKDKNGRWVVSFYRGEEKVFTEVVFSAPTHEYLSAREKQYNANRWVIIYQSPGITIPPRGLC